MSSDGELHGPDQQSRRDIERACRSIGAKIAGSVPPGLGFMLLLYDFGGAGSIAYFSNGQREDMIAAMKEFIARVEGRYVDGSE